MILKFKGNDGFVVKVQPLDSENGMFYVRTAENGLSSRKRHICLKTENKSEKQSRLVKI